MMLSLTRRAFAAIAFAGFSCAGPALLSTAPAQAASYPDGPVTIVVPYAAGGGTDIIARLAAEHLRNATGGSFVVENRAGAGAITGAATVAKSKPDGKTILVFDVGQTWLPALHSNLPYDPDTLDVISILVEVPVVVAGAKSFAPSNLKEVVAAAKAEPAKLFYGSGQIGGANHVPAEVFSRLTGIEMTHVPYKGAAPAVTDLLAGRLQLMFLSAPNAAARVASKDIKALGVAGDTRLASMPDVPTAREQGIDFNFKIWWGLAVPKGTPAETVAVINSEMNRMLKDPAVREKLKVLGSETVLQTSVDEARARKKADAETYIKVIKDAGIKLQ